MSKDQQLARWKKTESRGKGRTVSTGIIEKNNLVIKAMTFSCSKSNLVQTKSNRIHSWKGSCMTPQLPAYFMVEETEAQKGCDISERS